MTMSTPRAFLRDLSALLLLMTLLCPLPATADYTAAVDPGTRYQTLEGWGTSLAWWPNVIGGFPESYRADYLNKIFDPVQGLGLNVVRYNIGGGEAPGKHYLGLREAVPGYEPAPGQWDWSADINQRRILFESLKKGVNVFEAFSNSPPYWMTRSGSVTGMPDGSDNLDPKYNGAFADYLATVAQHFHDDWGLTFRTVEPVNEPSGGWWKLGKSQEGCHFSRPAQTAIVNALGASLTAKGLSQSTAVSSPDENSIDDAVTTWTQYDASARAYLGQLNTHSYGGSARIALRSIARANHKRLWMSEYGDGDASGMKLSKRILSDMKLMRPVAWVYWQAVDGGGWGLLVNRLNDPTHYAYTVNEKYYVLANYTKFIRPGDTFIDIADAQSLAAYNAKSGKLVIVSTNDTDASTNVIYDLSRFRRLPASLRAYRTSATENLVSLPDIPLTGKKLVAALPAHSVTTFVLAGATGALPSPPKPFDESAVYQILNAGSGQALSVRDDSTAPAADAVLSAPSASSSQQWSLETVEGGYYEIINHKSALALDVNKASTAAGANVIQWHDADALNQQWTLVPALDGAYTLLNRNSGLPLDVSPNGIIQQTAGPAATQRWRIVKIKPN